MDFLRLLVDAFVKDDFDLVKDLPEMLDFGLQNIAEVCLALDFIHIPEMAINIQQLPIDDLRIIGIEKCYLLDFVGPPGFALQLSRTTNCEVICFDHRKSTLKTIESPEACLEKVKFHVDVERSSSRAVYEYFSSELKQNQKVGSSLLDSKDQERVELLLSYIEDVDLRRWRLTDINAFKIGMGEWRSRMNCITNPFMFDQLMELKVEDLVSKGNSLIQPCKDAGKNVLDKAFKLRLGKGIYGECLAVRADGNSHLSDEIGKELSLRSSAAGLRPIGAVIYTQRNNLKMCLRSVDSSADTSEIAKCFALIKDGCKDKFASKARRCVFLGYPHAQKAYKLLDIDTGRSLVSRDVSFHENNLPFKTKPEVEPVAISPSLPLVKPAFIPEEYFLSPSPVNHELVTTEISTLVETNNDLEVSATVAPEVTPVVPDLEPLLRRSSRVVGPPRYLQQFVCPTLQNSVVSDHSSPTPFMVSHLTDPSYFF
ncbi:hypothetical protein V2J09_002586 [Rumex salicifolius]